MKLSIVMPVYNEQDTLRDILDKVRATPYEKEIVIVDDCSTDGTGAILEDLDGAGDLIVLRHERNRGKGGALRTGFGVVTGDIVIVQDADLEYDPAEYGRLIEPIMAGRADVVYGSRFAGGPRRVLYFWHTVANHILTLLSNMLTNLNLTDMETCYKVFRRDVLERITIRSDRFGVEPEITAKVARLGVRLYEIPISYNGRTYQEGKKIGWRDAVSAIYSIFRFHFSD
jgi:glycosyltransferase involved in cell wall biosynthesis